MSTKIELVDLADALRGPIGLFVGMLSFEARSMSILRTLGGSTAQCLLFYNSGISTKMQGWLTEAKAISHALACATVDLDDPLSTADSLTVHFAKALDETNGTVFVDITTFTHEQLLIFLKVILALRGQRRVVLGYTGAEEYSINTDEDRVWLSRGVSGVRSVLGYPGALLPSKQLHLVVLVGFEHDRAQALIERFEPTRLSLGVGTQSTSITAGHYARNQRFFEKVQRFVSVRKHSYEHVDTFEFSCVSPEETRDAILAQAGTLSSGYNVVVCPLNTKLSTVGAALAAWSEPKIQIAYARAIEYNESGYATPQAFCRVYELG